ncbi:MAG: hypothetical protein WCO51_04710 [bacterium]|jgi:hypothetical protein
MDISIVFARLKARQQIASLGITLHHFCPLKLIQKDISTVAYKPQRLWRWVEIAMEVVQGSGVSLITE